MPADRILTLLRRVVAMDTHEIFVRLSQEIDKRLDAIRYRSQPPEFAETEPPADAPDFYFAHSDVPEILDYWQRHLPGAAADTIASAEQICERRFDLLGFDRLSFGEDIDWHFDPVNNVRVPLKPWYQLEKADISPADRKIVWELNRHQHFTTLAKAFLLTRDQRFLTELVSQWNSWHTSNPYPLGINWSSSLEVAFRSISWLWLEMLLREQPGVPGSWLREVRAAQSLNVRHLSRYLSAYSGPNTHLLGELVALFLVCTCYPTLPGAAKWGPKSLREIEKQAVDQVLADGFHFEQSTHYHVYALDFFLHFMLIAKRQEIQLQPSTESTIQKMLVALAAISQSQQPYRIGDDDGGRVFDPQRNRNEHLLDPLVIGSAYFRQGDWKFLAKDLTEECLWLLGTTSCDGFFEMSGRAADLYSTALADSGIYVMVADSKSRWQLGIDAGPQGTGNSGHGHADSLSVQLSSVEGLWLVDSGTFSYSDNDGRNEFRSTRAHNTVEIDGVSQATPVHAFAWANLPTTSVARWSTSDECDYFRGHHDGYERLSSPAKHSRRVVRIGEMWVVFDEIIGTMPGTQIALRWHIAPEVAIENTADNTYRLIHPSDASLGLVFTADEAQSVSVQESSYSEVYGVKQQNSVLLSATTQGSPRILTVLAPEFDELSVVPVACEAGYAYDLRNRDSMIRLIFGDGDHEWICGTHSGRAEFACYRGSDESKLEIEAKLS